MPKRRRCATRSSINTTSNLRDIAEVWRRGSVIASWLLDLTATALAKDPALTNFAGRVSDSGEGRWTIKAAIDEAVPAPVLSTALYERFSSRGEADVRRQAAVGHALRIRRTPGEIHGLSAGVNNQARSAQADQRFRVAMQMANLDRRLVA